MNNGFKLISSVSEIGDFINDLMLTQDIGLDTESAGLDWFNDRFLLLQVCVNNNIYIFDPVSLGEHFRYIVELINDSGKVCIGHNIKYDMKVLKYNGGIMLSKVFDTMVVENVLMAGLGDGFPSLQGILEKYLNIHIDKDIREEFIGAYAVTQEMLVYSALDVKHLSKLRQSMISILDDNKLFQIADMENKLIPVVAEMEYEGVLINTKLWTELTNTAQRKIDTTKIELDATLLNSIKGQLKGKNAFQMYEYLDIPTKSITKGKKAILEGITDFDYAFNAVRERLNFGSHVQLKRVLNLNGIPAENTNAKELDKFREKHPIIKDLLIYKENAKRISSFGTEFIQKINPKTHRLHSSFNQIGTATGRWSCDSPNLQQVPRDTGEDDSKYRDCFIARPGYKILTVDYNQAELRLLGAVSGESEFIKAYQTGIDIHTLTASHIYYKSIEEIIKNERWTAKQVNFAIVYGSTEYGLFYNFGIPIVEGREHLKNFFKAYPSIYYFMEYAGKQIWERKYSVTPYGRKRFFENKFLFNTQWEAEKYKASVTRKGVNHIIQGGSADILKLSFIDIYYNNPFGEDLKILMSVHDEGVYEVKEDIVDDAVSFVVGIMESTEQKFLGEIPAKADYVISDHWSK